MAQGELESGSLSKRVTHAGVAIVGEIIQTNSRLIQTGIYVSILVIFRNIQERKNSRVGSLSAVIMMSTVHCFNTQYSCR